MDMKSGGIKAIHNEHNLNKDKGWYETYSQDAGVKKWTRCYFGSRTSKQI